MASSDGAPESGRSVAERAETVPWQRWLIPGLALTALMTLLALAFQVGGVERDLVARADAELAADGQGWATVAVDGRDVTVLGTAPSTAAQVLAIESAGRVFGARVVLDGSGLIPIASPYVWQAVRSGESLAMSGSVPSPEVKDAVQRAAASVFPGARIGDETAFARGVPDNFLAGVGFALGLLRGFDEAQATLTDTELSLAGVAPDQAAFAATRNLDPAALPEPFTLGPVDVLPPRAVPYLWSAQLGPEGIEIAGGAPDDAVRMAIAEAAAATFPGVAIIDRSEPASGEPAGHAEAAAFGLELLARLGEGTVTLTDRALSVAGTARTVDDYEILLELLATGLPGGYAVGGAEIGPAVVSPYFWQAVRTAGGVTLSGYVPSAVALDEVRAAASAAFPSVAVIDSVRVADGAPTMDWIGAIKFALGQIALLESGTVGITGKTYQINGIARSVNDYAAIREALGRTLPASLELGTASVSPPIVSPYRLAGAPEGAALALDGHAPDEASHAAIRDAAASRFGSDGVVDRLALAGGAPEGYTAAAIAALQAASRLAGGRFEIVDQAVALSGEAYYRGGAAMVEGELAAALPDGFTAAAEIGEQPLGAPLDSAGCQDLLRGAVAPRGIEFEPEAATILPSSLGVLDRIAAVLHRCPDVRIEIGGHTDSDGSASFNLGLSTDRANAVLDFLVSAGILRERLDAVGYGETRPIASNGTAEGRAQNRRIEFNVLEG